MWDDAVVAGRVLHHVNPLDEGLDLLASFAPLLVVDEFASDRIDRAAQDWYEGQHRMLRASGARAERPGRSRRVARAASRPAPARRAARGAARALRRARARVGAVPLALARRPEQRVARADADRRRADPGDRLPLGGRRGRRRRAPRRRRGSPRRACRRGSPAARPDSASSCTMSAPPTSSPPTNTCGIVGQPESSDSAWRIAGSGRTFTAVTGAPASRSARSARSELPHMTNCGVPFMKSATGSFSITFLMLSEISLMSSLSS